jgi:hypothetical protein
MNSSRVFFPKVEKFEQLTEYWKYDLIKSRFGLKLTTGMNFESFLKDVSTSTPFSPAWLGATMLQRGTEMKTRGAVGSGFVATRRGPRPYLRPSGGYLPR